MRRKLVVGNWKMNLHWNEALTLVTDLINFKLSKTHEKVDIVVLPPMLYLRHALELIKDKRSNIILGAQNCASVENGAFTGEVSASMIQNIGCQIVLIGHSERRQYHHETNELLVEKMKRASSAGLQVIYCCGESLNERESNVHLEVIKTQLEQAFCKFSKEEISKWVVAYEPVWAIGTGKSATSAQAQEMHAFIRKCLAQHYGEDLANSISVLYGGSVNPSNAAELFSQPDVDGALIGGAALNYESFASIVDSAIESM